MNLLAKHAVSRRRSLILAITLLATAVMVAIFPSKGNTGTAMQTDIPGPPGSAAFGTSVTVLPNGNFVVTDPAYDPPGPVGIVGAVHLYDGATLTVISTLTGIRFGSFDNLASRS